jgi:hypothetical protein
MLRCRTVIVSRLMWLQMWDKYCLCECGQHFRAPSGKVFFINYEVCPDCGIPKDHWKLVIARFIPTSVWYDPSTWGDGRWEYKGEWRDW